MSKKDKTLKGIKTPSRRKFFKAAAATGAVAAATLAMPSIAKAATTLKVQAAWGGGIFLENAQAYVKRVNDMAGGSLKIDLLPVNSVVKTSQMQDAVHRGVLDGAHYVPAYWYSKSPAASLFGTGPCWGWSAQELLGWIQYGGGMQLFNKLMGSLGLNLVSFFNSPMPAQPLGWFKEQIKKSKNPTEEREKLTSSYSQKFYHPYLAAQKGYIDSVIFPRQTRNYLIEGLKSNFSKKIDTPKRKHGNIPL